MSSDSIEALVKYLQRELPNLTIGKPNLWMDSAGAPLVGPYILIRSGIVKTRFTAIYRLSGDILSLSALLSKSYGSIGHTDMVFTLTKEIPISDPNMAKLVAKDMSRIRKYLKARGII